MPENFEGIDTWTEQWWKKPHETLPWEKEIPATKPKDKINWYENWKTTENGPITFNYMFQESRTHSGWTKCWFEKQENWQHILSIWDKKYDIISKSWETIKSIWFKDWNIILAFDNGWINSTQLCDIWDFVKKIEELSKTNNNNKIEL